MIIYGPFKSRRLGLSLGVNILPWIKSCTFNCLYCEIGHTPLNGFKSIEKKIVPPDDFLGKLDEELSMILQQEYGLDSITIGYNGEPTLVNNLDDIIKKIKEIKFRFKSQVPISLFTNSSTILIDDVCLKISKVDQIIAKLDCALQNLFLKINKPHPSVPKITEIIDGLKNYKFRYPKNNLILQTLLVDGVEKNFEKASLDALITAYNDIQPDFIQIYTISRPPASKYIQPLNLDKMKEVKYYIFNKIDPPLKEKIEVFSFRK